MRKFSYKVSAIINDEAECPIFCDNQNVGFVKRVYSNRMKKLLDSIFDDRYFVQYECSISGKTYITKKVARRGKLWFEGMYEGEKKKTIIGFENWRLAIPELKIINEQVEIKIEKELENPSRFFEGNKCIATWHAKYIEQEQMFEVTFELLEEATVQEPAFYIAISQATLFIGA